MAIAPSPHNVCAATACYILNAYLKAQHHGTLKGTPYGMRVADRVASVCPARLADSGQPLTGDHIVSCALWARTYQFANLANSWLNSVPWWTIDEMFF